MKNKILITITTLNGSKQYSLSKIVKKFLIFIVIFSLIVIITTFFFIKYLNNVIDEKNKELNKNKTEMTKVILQKENLKNKIFFLQNNIHNLEKEITQKETLLNQVNDRIEDIERIIQYTPPKNVDIKQRIDLAKLNLIDKKFILQTIPNGSPIPFKGISSNFGWRVHPIYKKREFHTGLDMRAKMNTPVRATADGIIEFARYHKTSGYGNLVIISHNFGFKTLFGHLNKIVVKQGQFVKKGQIVAYTGNSGLSSGPHLHYEIRYIGVVLSPIYFIKWGLKNYNSIFKKEKKVYWQGIIQAISECKSLLKEKQ